MGPGGRPRTQANETTFETSGKRTMRPNEVTSSGTVPVHRCHACSTSALRSIGKNRTPAYNSRTGYSRISSAVTTPAQPPPPADRPEQVRLVVRAGADEASVRGHEFGCGDAVGGQPAAAGQPAHPAAEGIAGHADVRGGARERGQAVLPGRDGRVPPDGAGPGPGGAGAGSMRTACIRGVLSSSAPSSDSSGPAPWPVPCGAIRIPRERANRTA